MYKTEAAKIIGQMDAAISKAVEELVTNPRISLEEIQATATRITPSIAQLIVQVVAQRRLNVVAKSSGAGDSLASGPSNVVPVLVSPSVTQKAKKFLFGEDNAAIRR